MSHAATTCDDRLGALHSSKLNQCKVVFKVLENAEPDNDVTLRDTKGWLSDILLVASYVGGALFTVLEKGVKNWKQHPCISNSCSEAISKALVIT